MATRTLSGLPRILLDEEETPAGAADTIGALRIGDPMTRRRDISFFPLFLFFFLFLLSTSSSSSSSFSSFFLLINVINANARI